MVAHVDSGTTFQKLVDLKFVRNESSVRKRCQDQVTREQERRRLARSARIEDDALIDRLMAVGFTADSISALTVAPIALVAWASGSVTRYEELMARLSIHNSELAGNSLPIVIFRSWLLQRPRHSLRRLWRDFTVARLRHFSQEERWEDGQRLLHAATRVAMASGGVLGLGAVCPAEKAILDEIKRLYELP